MSHGLHTHAPHEEVVDEAAHSNKRGTQPVGRLFTALTAALGAMVSRLGCDS